ncbi:adenylate kinase [Chloroflexota bacterium]
MTELGHYIVVYGPTGSGKTTLAEQISQLIGVSHIELDEIFWQPGWVEKPLEEFRAEVSAVLSEHTDGWVMDGNYNRVRDLTLPLADTIIWWRPPYRVAFRRLLKRTVSRCRDGTLLWGTNYESWRKAFLSSDSLIIYQAAHWRAYGRIGKNFEEIPHRAKIIEFHSQKEIDAFLESLQGG